MDVPREMTIATDMIEDFLPEVPPAGDAGENPSLEDLNGVLIEHRKNFINSQSQDFLLMEVRRGSVLNDALALIRYSQEDLHNPIQIQFCGEDGVDLGGLRREFWSLFLHNVTHSFYVTGKTGRLTFQPNYVERKKKVYFNLGQLVALSILQDGPGLPVFSDVVTDYLVNGEIGIFNPDDLSVGLRDILQKMSECTVDGQVRDLYRTIMDEATDAGFIVPITSFSKRYISTLQAALIEHQVSSCKDELDQFIQGLETHQVLSLLRQPENRACTRALFSGRVKPVTVATLRALLRFKYAEGNASIDQKATSQGFLTFIQASKGTAATINNITLNPKDILMWLTGSTMIPAVGFHKPIDVDFGTDTFVNTCALCVTLKLQPKMSPDDAVLHYTELFINSQTFTKE